MSNWQSFKKKHVLLMNAAFTVAIPAAVWLIMELLNLAFCGVHTLNSTVDYTTLMRNLVTSFCFALGLTGLAGGAAVAGCCAQMIGFAVMSYKENGVGGLISQGLGTSMLQMGNIVKNPRIWIAPTLASAITGPLATCVFHMEMNGAAVSSGMGTCGLVGQIGVYTGWVSDIAAGTKAAITPMDWAALVLICFVLPAVLSVLFCEIERKLGWIKDGDLKLN